MSTDLSSYRLIEECWHDNKAKRLTFRQILTRLDTVHYSMAHKRAERFLLSLNMYVCGDGVLYLNG